MIRWTLPLLFCLSLAPARAQDTSDPPTPKDDGPSLMERGADMFLRGLMDEMDPALRGMEDALREMEPELRQLIDMIGDLRNYEPPEKLPNGDIIIRRKPVPPAPLKDGEIEL
ncbi:hypothetical protein SAMN04488103_11298 [Gemmobacter aquatilis]|uniref:AAA+ family ATPase n=1 Tax=Gemmobacter aquatilis TaxID=933059 RepID=A0A1H8M7H3_9RHOB|nr:AAA+ family ATPase [Gemmobacter aquatilis]SEO13096.1 hypothetical protein SAMN04488103_11298 [Gemmobacter aquatilis]